MTKLTISNSDAAKLKQDLNHLKNTSSTFVDKERYQRILNSFTKLS